MKTTIYYSVQNCGDGSAYPSFFESQELADLDQEYQVEGWGEPCTGSITIDSDGPFTSKDVQSKEDVLKEMKEEIFDDDGTLFEDESSQEVQHYREVQAL